MLQACPTKKSGGNFRCFGVPEKYQRWSKNCDQRRNPLGQQAKGTCRIATLAKTEIASGNTARRFETMSRKSQGDIARRMCQTTENKQRDRESCPFKQKGSMTSVTKDRGNYRIRFYDGRGYRQQIRLPGFSKAQANQIAVHVDELNAANIAKLTMARSTAVWLASVGDVLYSKLAKAELVEPRESAVRMLAEALEYHIKRGKTKTGRDASGGTLQKWRAAAGHLNDFFGDCAIETITAEHAEQFRDWLGSKTVKSSGAPFTENTIRSVIASVKMFFNAFQRRKWVVDNAFEGEVSGTQANRDRMYFVTRDAAARVIEACPDAQWRLMFALWRFAGLRKMEVFDLRWEHVLWDRRLLVVPSSKTAHHEGKDQRIVPAAEVLPYLEPVFNEAPEGCHRVITRYSKSLTNVDKPMAKILTQAGVVRWPKLFQNLRSSCETEWLDWVGPNGERNSAHVVASWVGHSINVQDKHYAQVDEHHFDVFNAGVTEAIEARVSDC